jgi:hypothetical protein
MLFFYFSRPNIFFLNVKSKIAFSVSSTKKLASFVQSNVVTWKYETFQILFILKNVITVLKFKAPSYNFARYNLCPDTICARYNLCPDTICYKIQLVPDTICSRYSLFPIQFVPNTICADTICANTNCADTICADTICT